ELDGVSIGLDPLRFDRYTHRLGPRAGCIAIAERDALQLILAGADAGVDHGADSRELGDLDAHDVARAVADDSRLLRLAALGEALVRVDGLQRQILRPQRPLRHVELAHRVE